MTTQQWQTAENLFHSALELPPADRAAWVEQSCPSDPSLAAAVIRMLEADASPNDEIRQVIRSAVKQWMTA